MSEALEPAKRWELVPVALLVGLIGWLCVTRISLHFAATSSSASWLLSLPSLWFWIPVAALALPAAIVAIVAILRVEDARRVRVFYVFAVLVLMVQLLVLPDVRFPAMFSEALLGQAVLENAAARLREHASDQGLPITDVEQATIGLPPPSYRVRGVKVLDWMWETHARCDRGPQDVGSRRVGTIVWCVDEDRRLGRLSMVGTGGASVGVPAWVRDASGEVLEVEVVVPSPN